MIHKLLADFGPQKLLTEINNVINTKDLELIKNKAAIDINMEIFMKKYANIFLTII